MNWRRFFVGLLAYVLSISMVGSMLVWLWFYLVGYDEYKAVEILASREVDLGVSVYAQFSLSQVFKIQPAAEVIKLVIPLYVPDATKPVLVTLAAEDRNIAAWKMSDGQSGVREADIYDVELKLDEPTVLGGEYRLVLNGRDISHEEREQAPRVFVEKDDSKYKGGSYWIAGNKKDGDISMQVIARRARWQGIRSDWTKDPLKGAVVFVSWLLLMLTIWVGPHVALRWIWARRDD
jgi:hypothetical protein